MSELQTPTWLQVHIIITNLNNRVSLCGTIVIIYHHVYTVGVGAGAATFGQALPCVMGCRILLNLREAAYKQSGPSTMANISTLKFAQHTTRQRTVRSTLAPHEAHENYAENDDRQSAPWTSTGLNPNGWLIVPCLPFSLLFRQLLSSAYAMKCNSTSSWLCFYWKYTLALLCKVLYFYPLLSCAMLSPLSLWMRRSTM